MKQFYNKYKKYIKASIAILGIIAGLTTTGKDDKAFKVLTQLVTSYEASIQVEDSE